MQLINALIYLIFLLIFVQNVHSDMCNFTSVAVPAPNANFQWAIPQSQLLACYKIVPLNITQNNQTLAVLNNVTSVYSFTDIVYNSGPPFNMTVDLQGGLATVSAKMMNGSYTNQFDFQMDLVRLFNSLKDAHTLYLAPLGFSCTTLRPFDLQAVLVNGTQQVYLRGSAFQSIFANFSWLQSLNNSRIIQINGIDVLTYLMNYANSEVRNYKDNIVRVNSLFRQKSQWGFSAIYSNGLAANEDIDFFNVTVANGTVVTLQKLALCIFAQAWASVADVQALNDIIPPPPVLQGHTMNTVDPFEEQMQLVQFAMNTLGLKDIEEPIITSPLEGNTFQSSFNTLKTQIIPASPVNNGPPILELVTTTTAKDFAYFAYKNASVFKLNTFNPANMVEIQQVISRGYTDAVNRGVKNLIVDVTGNGGGIICLGFLFNSLLAKDWVYGNLDHNSSVYALYDFRVSPIIDNVISSGVFFSSVAPSSRINATTKQQETDYSYYNNKILKTRGGRQSYYTQKDYFPNCKSTLDQAPIYYFDNIVVISDGTCGSTCAAFIIQLSYYGYCKVMTHGGVVGYDMDISSFAGGNVLEWVDFANNVNNTSIVSKLTTTGRTRFNFNEAYLADQDTPKEFINYRGDYHTYMWDAVFSSNYTASLQNLERLYSTAYTIFPSIPQSSRITPNGISPLQIIIISSVVGAIGIAVVIAVGYYIYRYRKRNINDSDYKKLPVEIVA